ncbi:TonB-dependent receptor [Aliamphritea spongicola]|uniref:TonB-dependent receptor n=1 Tax=Aliamphritea spongicola TaxID=707589 RepID=UPI00196B9389|nr:TonB-dependent receptor [Aliamphritea spongicola]MBN3561924.1 TonB-dependent receptor [Aliamphritea spongicola]
MAHFNKNALALAVAANMSFALPALAENTASAQEAGVVIVTGSKIDRPEDKTLASVEVITEDEIRAHGDQTLSDIISRTPGLYTQSDNEDWGIRGIPLSGLNDQGPASPSGAISVFVDDAVQMQSLLTSNPLGLWDVQQVEVHSGSQSTTQGRNSLAGAVVIRTNDPTFEPEFAARTNAGSFGQRGGSVLANGELIDGTVAGRVAIDYQSEDGYIENIARNEDANDKSSLNARAKLLIQPSADMDLLLTFAHVDNKAGTNAVNQSNGVPSYYKLSQNTDTKSDVKQDSATAKLDYYLTDELTLTSITSGTKAELDTVLDFDQSAGANQIVPRKQEQKTISQELRLGYNADTLDGFLGVYFAKYTGKTDDQFFNGATTLIDVQGDIDIENKALFGEANWRFQDRWELTGGFRFDNEKNTTKLDYQTNLVNSATDANVSTEEDVFLPKLGLSYDLSDKQTVGIVWKKGYRSGGVNLRTGSSHQAYDAEFTTTTELSWRGKWLDDRITTKANIYHTKWKDQQVSVQNGTVTDVVNAADSQLQGLELSAEFAATDQLTLFTSAAYNDTEYKNFVDGTDNYNGQEFLFAPKFTASVGANYQFNKRWMMATDVIYRGDSVSGYTFDGSGNVTDERRNDSVTLVNVNTEYAINDNFRVSGYVKNLFDKEYITNNQTGNVLDVGAPMTFGVALRYDY